MLTVGAGVPLGVAIGGANKNDHKLMQETLTCLPITRPEPTEEAPQGLCLDKGYDYDSVRELAAEFGFTLHLRTRGEEAQAVKQEACYKARRRRPSSRKPATRRGAGWWSAHILG